MCRDSGAEAGVSDIYETFVSEYTWMDARGKELLHINVIYAFILYIHI